MHHSRPQYANTRPILILILAKWLVFGSGIGVGHIDVGAEIARLDIARPDNSAPYCKGGHRETCFSVRVDAHYKFETKLEDHTYILN